MWKLKIALMIVIAVFNSNNLYVTNNPSETIVTYETLGDTFNMDLIVSGKGSVSNGEEVIRNQKRNYVLTSGESQKYILKPDKGSRVQKVLLNDIDITTTVEENKALVVTVVDEGVKVAANFSAHVTRVDIDN